MRGSSSAPRVSKCCRRAQVVLHTVDLHEHLVQVPTSEAGPHPLDAALSDISREDRAKAEPPEPDGLVADVDAASCTRSSTFLSESGKRSYSITARRMISRLVSNHLNGLGRVMGGKLLSPLPRRKLGSSDTALRTCAPDVPCRGDEQERSGTAAASAASPAALAGRSAQQRIIRETSRLYDDGSHG